MTRNWVEIDQKRGIDALFWAKRYCPSYITVDAIPIERDHNSVVVKFHYRFYFSDSRDQTAFALRWV